MTSNQIAAKEALENKRSNLAREKETNRSNRAKEAETRTANRLKFASDLIGSGLGLAGKFVSGSRGAGKGNDPSWYNQDKEMVEDTAKISFDTPLGSEKSLLSNIETTTTEAVDSTIKSEVNTTNPGVMTVRYVPTIGNKSTVQTAGLNIYSYIRHANSGSRNYEYQDLMKYLLAVDSIYIGIAELKRIYSIMMTYKGHSRFYSQGYLRALGFNDENSRLNNINLASLRYSINQLCLRVNSLYVPNVMSYYVRHTWMSSTIFKDSEIKRSQNYMFTAHYLYKYDETPTSVSFGCLVPFKFINETDTVENVISKVSDALDVLMRSEDIGIISGDILKAYGEGNLFFVPSITEDYHIEEVYDPEVLSQFTNASIMGDIYTPSFIIYEDKTTHELIQGYNEAFVPESMRYNLNIAGNTTPLTYAHHGHSIQSGKSISTVSKQYGLVNMYKDNPSVDDVMVATRLVTIADFRTYPSNEAGNFQGMWRILSNGSEIATEVRVVSFRESDEAPGRLLPLVWTFQDGDEVYPANDFGNEFIAQFLVSAFDWAPMIRRGTIDTSNGNRLFQLRTINIDICNFTTINQLEADRMHRTALLSEFGVPYLGIKVRTR